MVLGSAIAFMFIASAAVGDVISFNTTGSGSVGVSATLYDPNDNSNRQKSAEGPDEVATALSDGGMCAGLRKLRDDGVV